MVPENKEVKKVRQQIAALAAETRMTSSSFTSILPNAEIMQSVSDSMSIDNNEVPISGITKVKGSEKKAVRSFIPLSVESCECLPILLSVYHQVIDHCFAVGEGEKLFETYMEYCRISECSSNIPQAIRLLMEAEDFVNNIDSTNLCRADWIRNWRMARILTFRGSCMLESDEIGQAERHLLRALSLFNITFPNTKCGIKLRDAQESYYQSRALCMPRRYIGCETEYYRAQFFEYAGSTLSKLYQLFDVLKQPKKAALAAKWALNYQWKGNTNFRQLCIAYSHMVSVYRLQHKFSKCLKLQILAMEMVHRKKGQLDVTEVYPLVMLYTSIFLFFVENGKKAESLEFGLSVMPMLSNVSQMPTSQMLVLWMLKLLLCDFRLHEMIVIMGEFFYMSDHYDLSAETWYYCYAMVIFLDTGYCVESYNSCENFYTRKGDAIVRSKTPEAAWNYFVCMWLVTVRVGAWERSILWEEKIRSLFKMTFEKNEFHIMLLVRLLEGYLICLVYEIDKRNVKRIEVLTSSVDVVFTHIKKIISRAPLYEARYFLLLAYYKYIKGKRPSAFHLLKKAHDIATKRGDGVLRVWTHHIDTHWKGKLQPRLVNYWTDHIETHNLLDYNDFDPGKMQIVPYTLPLPRALDLDLG